MYSLHKTQVLKASTEEIWDFISSPKNLDSITPSSMKFEILNGQEIGKMYPGQIIEYNISPFLGIKMHWVTEITHVQEGSFFVDEQRSGPYKFWHHQHMLVKTAAGTAMKDIIHYQLPFGILGNITHRVFVKKQLENIFDFRYRKLESIFNKV